MNVPWPRFIPSAEAEAWPRGRQPCLRLGPVTAGHDGAFLPLGPEMQRAALGLLAPHAPTALSRES